MSESIQDGVVLCRSVFCNRFESEDSLALRVDAHPFESFTLVRGDVRVEMSALHLKHGWSLVANRVQSFDQGRAHQLLLAVKVLADVLQLVDRVKFHGGHV